MKALLVVLFALASINCSKVKFNNDDLTGLQEVIDDGIDLGDKDNDRDDDINDDDKDDKDDDDKDDDVADDDSDDDTDDGLICPRYDLVVKSSHANNKKLNFKFNYNGEIKNTSVQGKINVLFLKDGVKKFTQCSGEYTNTTISKAMLPLRVVEKLTSQVVITHGITCAAMIPERLTSLQVIDTATGGVLWDEKKLRDELGACEFGYTEEGTALREKILGLADGVVDQMAAACTK